MPADPNSPAAQAALKAAGWTPEQYRQYAATRPDLAGSGGGFAGVSDAELMAKYGIGPDGMPLPESNGSLSDLPLGYSYDRNTNQVYRQTANGPVAVGREELMAATLAEKQMSGGGGGGGAGAAPPRPESMIDPRTGELVMVDANGGVTHTGNILGFAGIDPREKAAADENQRGFENSLATYKSQMEARQQAIDQFEQAQNRLIQVAGQKEQGRQADLRAAVDQWQTAMNLIPQMGQLAIQESERVQGILQNGGDFLARAFESRGGTSPLAKVTQADQINAIGQSLHNLRSMIAANSPGTSPASGGGYQAPALGDAGTGPAGGFGAAPAAPTYTPYQMAPAPAVAPPSASAPAAADGGGGSGFAAAAPAYDPTASRDSWEGNDPASRAGALGLNSRDNPNMFPGLVDQAPAAPAPAPAEDWSPVSSEGASRGDPGAYDARVLQNAGGKHYFNQVRGFLGFKDGTPSQGYTTEPAFVINEKGPELVENLDGGRIRVHDAEATKKMVPGYDSGTLSPEKAAIMLHEGMANGQPLTDAQRGFFGARMHGYDEGTAGGYRIDNFAHRLSDASNLDYASLPGAMVGGGISGGGFRGLLGLLRRPAPAAGPLVRDVGLGAYSARRVGTGFVDAAQQAYGSVPRYATGTWDATSAINAYNSGNTGALTGFNSQYGGGSGTSSMVAPGPSAFQGIGNKMTYGTYGQGSYGGPGFAAQEARDRQINDARGWNDQASMWDRSNPNSGTPNPYRPAPFKSVSQRELNDLAKSTAPPAVTALLAGKLPPAVEQLKSTGGEGDTLPIFTSRQLSAMTPEEMKALGTTTNTVFNAPLDYIMGQTQRNYGAKDGMQRGFLRGAGL